MIAVPKLSHNFSHKRKNTVELMLEDTNQPFQFTKSHTLTKSVRELPKYSESVEYPNPKTPIASKKYPTKTIPTKMAMFDKLLLHKQKAVYQIKENFPPENFLPSFSKQQKQSPVKKKLNQARLYETAKLPSECFSPKYMKRKEENQKILHSLRLQNQKYKKMITDTTYFFSNNLSQKPSEISIFQIPTSDKPTVQKVQKNVPTLNKTDNLLKSLHKDSMKKSNKRKVLEEMPNMIMTNSFIIDETITQFQAQELSTASVSLSSTNNSAGTSLRSSESFKLCTHDFEIIKFLGKGNFGQVNLVKHKLTNFICAMKSIKKQFAKSENVEHQICRQIRIHQSLKHLNVIGFYGFFDDAENIYILTQYATGGQLYKKLKECYRMPENQVVPIIKNAVDGLKFIHSLGYIHRDLKPQNIIFQFGIGKICDLGWAVDCGFNETRKSYCGTPLYLSPEMIKKQSYDKSADIWSVGILTFELLVGKVPFNIWSQYDLKQIVEKEITFPTSYVDMSESCIEFIKKCLIKNPSERIKLQGIFNHPFLTQSQGNEYFNCEVYDKVQDMF